MVKGTKKCVLLVMCAVSCFGQSPRAAADSKNAPAKQLDATGWFQRAADQMNIRQTGSPPFHLKVVFHAFPGMEFANTPEIVTGDGVYEETWLSSRKWRREVTLGKYHAIEVQSDRERKVETSSDYEPSRVLMLLECLLYPIPRFDSNPEPGYGHYFWLIKTHSVGRLSYVTIGRTTESTYFHTVSYMFLPNGMLVQTNDRGLKRSWQDEVAFNGKAVPTRFSVQAEGKPLLTAETKIDSAGQVDPALFQLPKGSLEEGLTLTPLYNYQTRHLENLNPEYTIANALNAPFVFRFVVDRHGFVREFELVDGQPASDTWTHADIIRHWKFHPADIDGSPCELASGIFI